MSRTAISLVAAFAVVASACSTASTHRISTPSPPPSAVAGTTTTLVRAPTSHATAAATATARQLTATLPTATPTRTPAAVPHPAASSTLAFGAGPQAHYSVEAQPAAGSCHYVVVDAAAGEYLPDPHCTPGAISPAVTQSNLASTICKKGYTRSTRPPEDVTNAEKQASAAAYGYTGSFKTAEYDHFIPLELGGDPNDPRNFWVEPNESTATTVNNPKDGVESSLNYLVCNAIHGKPYLPLAIAQQLIATDWTTAKANAERYLISN